MPASRIRSVTTAIATTAFLFAWVTGSVTALPFRDRTAPPAPGNLRVTGTAPYSVSLAWNASSDPSGISKYTICCAHTNAATVSGSVTSFTFTAGVEANRSFSFVVSATDGAGNSSKHSNMVTVTTPRDLTPPSKPIVTVTDVGPTHVSLSWSSTDNGPDIWYAVAMDGTTVRSGGRETTGTFGPLAPQTTHTFVVRASDFANNVSPVSNPVSVTTAAASSSDNQPPTTPGNLRTNGMQFGDGETWLFWDQSSDNQTLKAHIEYRVFANGIYDHSTVGRGDTVLYGNPNAQNVYKVIAVDGAGNPSVPATLTVANF